MSVAGFKRAFQKAFQSNQTNYNIRKAKVQKAIAMLERAVQHLTANGGEEKARPFAVKLQQHRTAAANAERLAERKPGDAFKALEAVKEQARTDAIAAKNAAKKVPMAVRGSDGTPAKLYPSDIPGFHNMTDEQRAEVAQKVANKVGRGRAMFEELRSNPTRAREGPPLNQEQIADMVWFFKTRAQESTGEPYDRGALTLPDDDGTIQALLDRSAEVYQRGSSHMGEQQRRDGGKARGIDFYEGATWKGHDKTEIANIEKMMPAGMSTLLFQQQVTPGGKRRLYIKMEPHGARGPGSGSPTDEVRSREFAGWHDFKEWVLHGANFLIGGDHEDPALKTFREEVPRVVTRHVDAAIRAAQEAELEEAVEVLKRLKKGFKVGTAKGGSIGNTIATIQELIDGDVETNDALNGHFAALVNEVQTTWPTRNMEARIGGEVVLEDDDLVAGDQTAAIGTLNTQLAAVQRCQHTDELADLERVKSTAEEEIRKIKAKRVLAEVPAVSSVIQQLERAMAPLGRLIENKAQEELAEQVRGGRDRSRGAPPPRPTTPPPTRPRSGGPPPTPPRRG